MEVTCDRCSADYEFEESLISLSGTTVKCTSCGHLFKVHRDGTSVAASAPAPAVWSARHDSGRKASYDSLKTIARAIKRGELSRDTEISKTGKVWRKLGEIDELRRYFILAEISRPDAPPPPPRRPPPKPRPTPYSASSSDNPQSTHPRFEALGETIEVGEPSVPPRGSPETSTSVSAPPHPGLGVMDTPPPQNPSSPEAPLRRGSQPLLWAITLTVPALIFVVLLVLPPAVLPSDRGPDNDGAPSETAGASLDKTKATPLPNQAPVGSLTARADKLLASHDPRRFPEAIATYEKALERFPNDAHILSSLSRVYARWSQQQAFQLDDFQQGDSPLNRSSAASLQASQVANATAAKEFSIRAARRNPGNEEAEVALADALRLNGNLVGARTEIDRALRNQTPNSEALRVASLLTIAEAGGKLEAGQAQIEAALQLDDSDLVHRALWFRMQQAVGQTESARRILAELDEKVGSHPLLDHLRTLLPPSRPTLPQDGPEPATAPSVPVSPEDRVAAEELNSTGEKLLEGGQTGAAERKFKQALRRVPNSPQARTGLGYVALERNKPRRAVWHFQAARKAGYAEALIGLGEAYRALGRNKGALRSYRRYLVLHPNARSASIAAKQLALLKAQEALPGSPTPRKH